MEAIQGEGGYIVPPADFLPGLEKIARKHGILLIADEVQCGMGRTGKMFAFEHFDFHPDIIAMAKGIASGMPLGRHDGAVGAHDVGAGRARFDIWRKSRVSGGGAGNRAPRLQEQVRGECGEGWRVHEAKLADEFMSTHPNVVGDVRGRGLMIGSIVKLAHGTNRLRDAVIDECFKRGLLVLGAGASTIRLSPPLDDR